MFPHTIAFHTLVPKTVAKAWLVNEPNLNINACKNIKELRSA